MGSSVNTVGNEGYIPGNRRNHFIFSYFRISSGFTQPPIQLTPCVNTTDRHPEHSPLVKTERHYVPTRLSGGECNPMDELHFFQDFA